MNNFRNMVTKVFGEKAETVTRVLGPLFEGVEFKTEQEFLAKISYKLEKFLRIIDEDSRPGDSCNQFWFKRNLQLKSNRKDIKYIYFLVTMFSEIPIQELEENHLILSDELVSAYMDVYSKYAYAKEVDDSEFEKYLAQKRTEKFLAGLGQRRSRKGGAF